MENFEVRYVFSMFVNIGAVNFILLMYIIIITAVIHIHLNQGVYNKKSIFGRGGLLGPSGNSVYTDFMIS